MPLAASSMGGSATAPVIDVPFDFNNQLTYDIDAVLRPGERLIATCEFHNDTDRPILAGESSQDEMCVNFITAWPADALLTGRNGAGASGCWN